MKQYLDLLAHVLHHGRPKTDRTGTGTLSQFGWQMRFDLAEGFPLITTKRVHFKSVVEGAALVSSGRNNDAIAQGCRSFNLGRMGRSRGGSRSYIWIPVALLADPGWPVDRSDRQRH